MSYRLCWQNMTLQGFALLAGLDFSLVISVFYAFLFYVHYCMLCFFFSLFSFPFTVCVLLLAAVMAK